MLRAIVVEDGLDEIGAHLRDCGYTVFSMTQCNHPVQAVVYAGVAAAGGRQEPAVRFAKSTLVINAGGMDGRSVAAYLKKRL